MKQCRLKTVFVLASVCILMLTQLSACSSGKTYSFDGYLGTYSTITVQTDTKDISADIEKILEKIDSAVNTEVAGSDIAKFNIAGKGEEIEITEVTYSLLEKSLELYKKTSGLFNPATALLVDLWGFSPRFSTEANPATIDGHAYGSVPSAEYIAAFSDSTFINLETISLRKTENAFFVKKPDYSKYVGGKEYSMQLNLGGIAKGYAADKCAEYVSDLSEHYSVSIGMSSIRCGSSTKNDKGTFRVQIQHPRSAGILATVESKNEGASTSGDYQNCFFNGGKRYCHIINPATGYPTDNSVAAVSLFGGDAVTLDALSTAVMLMGKENGISFLNANYPSLKYIISVEENGTIKSYAKGITVEEGAE